MSKPLSSDDLDDLVEMLGGKTQSVEHTHDEHVSLEASVLAQRFRTLIKKAMREDDVTVRALAYRLGVSPSVISRRLSSDGDLKVWTAATLAHELGRTFSVQLKKTVTEKATTNRKIGDTTLSAPTTSGASQVEGSVTYGNARSSIKYTTNPSMMKAYFRRVSIKQQENVTT